MKNTLSIVTLPDGRVKTDFSLSDGVKSMQIHRRGLSDAKVLRKLLDKNFYQHFKGSWYISFPEETHAISRSTFELAIDVAQEYIFNRDNFTNDGGYG